MSQSITKTCQTDNTYPELRTKNVFEDKAALSDRDKTAIDDILTWRRIPEFHLPGRTAWYQLQDPFETENGVTVQAAKIKGCGGWNPADDCDLIGMVRGSNPSGLCQPSNTEYASDVTRSHFGISNEGGFCIAYSEPAPFGAITRKRAELEWNNTLHLRQNNVPAILPYRLIEYPDMAPFRGDPLSAVVSLVPAPTPTRLESFLIGSTHLNEAEKDDVAQLVRHFSALSGQEGDIDIARFYIAHEIGGIIRRMSATGRFRYGAGWDNFMFDPVGKNLFLTDLDSTMPLSILPAEIRGLQQIRDLGSALFRLANGLYRHFVIRSRSFATLRQHDPFAALLSGYFQIPIDDARTLTRPLWRYFGAHWFLLDKMADKLGDMSWDLKKSYNMDPSVFYCLVIWTLSESFRTHRDTLHLETIPDQPRIEDEIAAFLGSRVELVQLMAG